VHDEEARRHVVGAILGEPLGAHQSGLAPCGQPALRDQLPRELDRVRLVVDPDAGHLREPFGELHERPAAAAADIEDPRAGLEARLQERQLRQNELGEDPRQ